MKTAITLVLPSSPDPLLLPCDLNRKFFDLLTVAGKILCDVGWGKEPGKMGISNVAGSADNTVSDNRWFLYEVVGLRQNAETSRLGYPIRRSSSVFIKVPYSRMGHFMRRITRMGGKIISIQPLTTDSQAFLPLAWWVEISTTQPEVLYYFGPFDSVEEATSSQRGYIEDLQQENAQGIAVKIKWCQQPENLTVF